MSGGALKLWSGTAWGKTAEPPGLATALVAAERRRAQDVEAQLWSGTPWTYDIAASGTTAADLSHLKLGTYGRVAETSLPAMYLFTNAWYDGTNYKGISPSASYATAVVLSTGLVSIGSMPAPGSAGATVTSTFPHILNGITGSYNQTLYNAGFVGRVIKLAASQTADAWQLKDSSSSILAKWDAGGNLFTGASFLSSYSIPAAGVTASDSSQVFFGLHGRLASTTSGTSGATMLFNNGWYDGTNYHGINSGEVMSALIQNAGITYIGGSASPPASTNLAVTAVFPFLFGNATGGLAQTVQSPSVVGQLLTLAASQSADAWQVQSSTGTVLANVDSAGNSKTIAAFVSSYDIPAGPTATDNSQVKVGTFGRLASATGSGAFGLLFTNGWYDGTNYKGISTASQVMVLGQFAGSTYIGGSAPPASNGATVTMALPFQFNALTGAYAQTLQTTSAVGHTITLAASGSGDFLDCKSGASVLFAVTAAGLPKWATASNAQTTVGAAGAASALPATPTKYLKVVDSSGTTLVVPAYAAV